MAHLHLLRHYDPENSLPSTVRFTGGACVSLWFNGCSKHCAGCWNPETWGRRKDKLYRPNAEVIAETLEALDEHIPKNLALLGGDPLENSFTGKREHWNNVDDTYEILRGIKQARPHTRVICWTGYTWDECVNDEKISRVLPMLDILIDGRFEQALKIDNRMYGSSNQTVIDVKESLVKGRKVVFPGL